MRRSRGSCFVFAPLLVGCSAPTTTTGSRSEGAPADTLVASVASAAQESAPRAPAPGVLVVQEQSGGGRNYTEGSVGFVKLSRGEEVVLEERLDASPSKFSVPAGKYTITEYQRPCDGNCGNLDPPTDACTASIEIFEGASTRAVVTVRPGEACTMVVSDP